MNESVTSIVTCVRVRYVFFSSKVPSFVGDMILTSWRTVTVGNFVITFLITIFAIQKYWY
jgi:hypothetical protein